MKKFLLTLALLLIVSGCITHYREVKPIDLGYVNYIEPDTIHWETVKICVRDDTFSMLILNSKDEVRKVILANDDLILVYMLSVFVGFVIGAIFGSKMN